MGSASCIDLHMIRPVRAATMSPYVARMANTTSEKRRQSTQTDLDDTRRRLLDGLPVMERRLVLAGASTPVWRAAKVSPSCCCTVQEAGRVMG